LGLLPGKVDVVYLLIYISSRNLHPIKTSGGSNISEKGNYLSHFGRQLWNFTDVIITHFENFSRGKREGEVLSLGIYHWRRGL
jgi:hypothetical protein